MSGGGGTEAVETTRCFGTEMWSCLEVACWIVISESFVRIVLLRSARDCFVCVVIDLLFTMFSSSTLETLLDVSIDHFVLAMSLQRFCVSQCTEYFPHFDDLMPFYFEMDQNVVTGRRPKRPPRAALLTAFYAVFRRYASEDHLPPELCGRAC